MDNVEDVEKYYFGKVELNDYYGKNLSVRIFKNIPVDMLYNPLDGTSSYICICLCSDTEYLHIKDTPSIYNSIPIQKKFKEQYKHML